MAFNKVNIYFYCFIILFLGKVSPKVIAPITSASLSMIPEIPTAPEGRESSIVGLSHHWTVYLARSLSDTPRRIRTVWVRSMCFLVSSPYKLFAIADSAAIEKPKLLGSRSWCDRSETATFRTSQTKTRWVWVLRGNSLHHRATCIHRHSNAKTRIWKCQCISVISYHFISFHIRGFTYPSRVASRVAWVVFHGLARGWKNYHFK